MKKVSLILIVLLFSLTVGCHRNDPVADCGCKSKTLRELQEIDAAYGGNSIFYIVERSSVGSTVAIVQPCESIDTTLLIKNPTNYNYRLSGQLVTACPPAKEVITIVPIYELRSAFVTKVR